MEHGPGLSVSSMKADQVTGQLTVGQLAPRTGHPSRPLVNRGQMTCARQAPRGRPGRPPFRSPPGISQISGPANAVGPGMPQRRAPVLGGDKDQGPCGSRPGGIVSPGPQVPLPTEVRGGGPAGSGVMLPQSGSNCQQPAPPAGAGGASAAGSAKAAVTTGPSGPARRLSGRRPAALPTAHDRAGAATRRPRRRGCPARPGQRSRSSRSGWPCRRHGPAAQHPVPGPHLKPPAPRAAPYRVGGQAHEPPASHPWRCSPACPPRPLRQHRPVRGRAASTGVRPAVVMVTGALHRGPARPVGSSPHCRGTGELA